MTYRCSGPQQASKARDSYCCRRTSALRETACMRQETRAEARDEGCEASGLYCCLRSHEVVRLCMAPTSCGGSVARRPMARATSCGSVSPPGPESVPSSDARRCNPMIWFRSELGTPISISSLDSQMLVIGNCHCRVVCCRNLESGAERKPITLA
eukprot:5091936-Prymnesium_polylepis.1